MKVLHVVHWENSGIYSVARNLSLVAKDFGDDHEIVVLRRKKSLIDSVLILFRLFEILKIIRSRSVDSVHVHSFLPLVLSPLFKSDNKVFTVHSNYPFISRRDPKSILKKFSMMALIKLGNIKVTVVGVTIKSLLKEALNLEATVIPNGFILGDFPPPQEIRNICSFGVVGRLDCEKNIASIIRAFSLLEDLDINLVIVGDGRERHILKDLVYELNLANKVSILGFISDVQEIFQKIDALICASQYEGFGMVIGEAILNGKPIISTDVGFVKEFSEIGFTVTKTSPRSIANAIISLKERDIESTRKEVSSNIGVVKREFNINKVYKSYRNLIWLRGEV